MITSNYHSPLLASEKVFRDPVLDYIHVQHRIILDLIDSQEVQRLRRIKQLGTTSYTFHGAEHSRFSHSLGVYEITRRICDRFVRNYPIEKDPINGWDDKERLLTLCAALLHDIGHGPFSHSFEGIFNTDHEEMTEKIILSPDTEVNAILKRVAEDFPKKVASVINKTYPNKQVVDLISSQIDADRMDYLKRDAYFTGVTYGDFDLARILRVIRPYQNKIVFRIQGTHAVEDYIVSRYQMHMQVYFHHVSRGMEVTLERMLARAKHLYQRGDLHLAEGFLKPFFDENYTMQEYLRLDDGVLTTHMLDWQKHPDEILSNLAYRFLSRKPLKSVRFDPEKDKDLLVKLEQLIEKAGYNTEYYTAINSSYDLPYDFFRPNDANKSKTSIELIYENGDPVELSQISDLVASITGTVHGDHRFYVPKEFLSRHKFEELSLFEPIFNEFKQYVKNGSIHHPQNNL